MIKLAVILILLVYVGGIVKFLQGFRKTNFSRSLPTKIGLALLWPILFVANSSYRKNFQKTLKG